MNRLFRIHFQFFFFLIQINHRLYRRPISIASFLAYIVDKHIQTQIKRQRLQRSKTSKQTVENTSIKEKTMQREEKKRIQKETYLR